MSVEHHDFLSLIIVSGHFQCFLNVLFGFVESFQMSQCKGLLLIELLEDVAVGVVQLFGFPETVERIFEAFKVELCHAEVVPSVRVAGTEGAIVFELFGRIFKFVEGQECMSLGVDGFLVFGIDGDGEVDGIDGIACPSSV